MFKKCFLISMVLVLAMGLLAACGPKRDPNAGQAAEGKPDKLVVWENADQGEQIAHTKKLAAEFEKKTGIKVEVVPVSLLKQQEKLTLDGPAGKGADLVTWPHDNLGQAVVKGLVQPIKVDDSVTGQYEEGSIRALTYDGKLMGLPKVTESIALIYNKKLMPKPPETFEELYQFAKANTKPAEKKYGVLFEAANLYYTHFLISANGGYIFKDQGGKLDPNDIGLNNPGTVKALTEVQKWYKEGLIPQGVTADVINGLFKEGKVAAVINGPWAIRDYQSANIDLGVAPLPKVNGKDAQTLTGVKGWYLSAYSKSPKYATELMQFLTSKEALKTRFEQTGEIPPHKELLADPMITNDPVVNGFAEQAKFGVPMPSIPEMFQVWTPINDAHNFIASGKQSPEQALNQAVKLVKEQIKVQKQ
ncbi:extracellular solute-binding protein [Paenactinomyces guangxiensis]|uniref:Maltodextrin-binding protein n=1 Tax=Paenactinomyces guangxiensis TaxID=1490290 RepID=A0A7W2A6D1_9BACL|nr:extracellular solute-binding protein [Paenactinomyces guangxiensis]MBA4493231.1 extracellular solute-binding protein [Paenactinomyces guangxiensis]MBH8589919.1 extracellular solute-binding protein [Paenactinomyces guangxiensis]